MPINIKLCVGKKLPTSVLGKNCLHQSHEVEKNLLLSSGHLSAYVIVVVVVVNH